MLTPENASILRFEVKRVLTLREFYLLIGDAYHAYSGIVYCSDILPHQLTSLSHAATADQGRSAFASRSRIERILFGMNQPYELTSGDEPLLGRVHFNSPGWWEMVGNWNPIKQILDYLKFRAEHAENVKTNEIKRYQLALKNKILESEVIIKQYEALRLIGLERDHIYQILEAQIIDPLERLAKKRENDLIGAVDATIPDDKGKDLDEL